MKQLFVFLLMCYQSFAQLIPSTYNENTVVRLTGKGSISSLTDNVQVTRQTNTIPARYSYKTFVRSISSKKAGVGITIRNEGTKTNGSIASVHIILQNDSLKVIARKVNNQPATMVYSKSKIPIPVWIRADVVDNKLIVLYATQRNGQNFKQVYEDANMFNNWSTKKPGILNPIAKVISTAEIYNTALTTYTETSPNCNCNGTPRFVLETVAQVTNTNNVNMTFNSCNATEVKWEVLSNTGIVQKTGNINPTSASINADVTGLTTGSYTMRLSGVNCIGTSSKTFSFTSPTTDPGIVACSCSGIPTFSISNVTQVANSSNINFNFNSCNVTQLKWEIINSANTVLYTNTITPTSSTITASATGLSTGTYTLRASGVSCTGSAAQSFTFIAPSSGGGGSTTEESWVLHPDGIKIYNTDASVAYTAMNITISGTNSNIITETVQRGCPSGYVRSYSIDDGNIINTNNYGWITGTPQGIEIEADGRLHSIMIGCVGNVWTPGANQGIVDVYQEHVYIKKNPNKNRDGNGLTYVKYPSTFLPDKNSLMPKFFGGTIIPQFSLPTKHNIYEGIIDKKYTTVNLQNYGFKAWHLKNNAPFATSLNYITDPDTWVPNRDTWGANGMNAATISQAENLGATLVNSYPKPMGVLLRDDEWRFGEEYNEQGLKNEHAFFKKMKEISPSTLFGGHHMYPYKIPGTWEAGTMDLATVAKPFRSDYTKSQLITDFVNGNYYGTYWKNIGGYPDGENAGKYIDLISVNAYQGNYNPWDKPYKVAQETFVNKKYFPTSKVNPTVLGWDEVSVARLNGVEVQERTKLSWTYTNPTTGQLEGTAEYLWPMSTAAYNETVALIANFLGDGINFWGDFGLYQDTNGAGYYRLNDLYGRPMGDVNLSVVNSVGAYCKNYFQPYDYFIAGMWKMTQIPSDINQSAPFLYEMSIDNGATWITGDALVPANQQKEKRPFAFGMKNASGTKHAILVQYNANIPQRDYTFKIRHPDFSEKTITVQGQFPELIIFQ